MRARAWWLVGARPPAAHDERLTCPSDGCDMFTVTASTTRPAQSYQLVAPASTDRPGGLVHMLELKRRGEDLGKAQEGLAAWCAEQGVPFACYDDLRDAIAILSDWGALRVGIAR